MNDEELQDSANWDFEHPIPLARGSQSQRTIVSVPFKIPEFRRVRDGAEHTGEKLAAFIRRASLERADAIAAANVFFLSSSQEQGVSVTGVENTFVVPNPLSEKADAANHTWIEHPAAIA